MSKDFLGPGDTGPAVERAQRLLGVTITGVYDEETTLAVRGVQVLHRLPEQDGYWDATVEAAVTRRD